MPSDRPQGSSVRHGMLVPVQMTGGRITMVTKTRISVAFGVMTSPVALLNRLWRSVTSNTVNARSADYFSRLERGACIVTRGAGVTPPDLDLASAIREAEAAEETARQRVLELRAAEAELGAAKERLEDLKKARENAGRGSTAASASQKQQGAPARGVLAARKNLGMKKRSTSAMARLATSRQV